MKDHVLSKPEYAERKYEIRMSSAGDCSRMMDFDRKYGKKPSNFQQSMRMALGDAVHLMCQQYLREIYGEDFIACEQEVILNVEGVDVPGHPDGLIKSLNAIVEIKSTSQETFRLVTNQGPLPQHIKQGHAYAAAFGADHILYWYVNRNSGEMIVYFRKTEIITHLEVVGLFTEQIKNSRENIIGSRPYHDPTSAPCWYCDHKERCYEGFDKEISELGTGNEYTQEQAPNLFNAAVNAVVYREQRLLSQKCEDASRDLAAKEMLSLKERSVILKGQAIDLAVEIALSKGKEKKLMATIAKLKG
jgi:hypothetical protein